MWKRFIWVWVILLGIGVPFFLKEAGRAVFFEFQAPVWLASSYVEEFFETLSLATHSHKALVQEAQRVARVASGFELAAQQNAALREELTRLEGLLGLEGHPGYASQIARVIQAEYTPKYHQFIIRKGHLHGIQEGAGVVCASGVVGRVCSVHLYTSQVELVSSPRFQMVAQVAGDLRPLLFTGKSIPPGQIPTACAQNIPFDIRPQGPDLPLTLTTSGLGCTFPAGLHLGTLYALRPRPDGLFQEAQVQLAAPLFSVREVCVLVPNPTAVAVLD